MLQAVTLAALPVLVLSAFTHQDVQLFELRDKIIKDLGPNTDFYSWLGVKKSASAKEVISAYRKISRKLHSDRNPGQEASERFARLNQVYNILRSSARDRYDHYLSWGFPEFDAAANEWKSKTFRPNFLLSLVFIILVLTGLNFIILKASAHRKRSSLQEKIDESRRVASSQSPTGIITSPTQVQLGKFIFTVHPDGNVYFEGVKVDANHIEEPTFSDTLIGRLIRPKPKSVEAEQPVEVTESTLEVPSKKKVEPEVLKKGAARRRPAAARGNAKIF